MFTDVTTDPIDNYVRPMRIESKPFVLAWTLAFSSLSSFSFAATAAFTAA